MSRIFGNLWDRDEDQPELCADCTNRACPHESEFFWPVIEGVRYGPMACGCLCDPVNVEQRVSGS